MTWTTDLVQERDVLYCCEHGNEYRIFHSQHEHEVPETWFQGLFQAKKYLKNSCFDIENYINV